MEELLKNFLFNVNNEENEEIKCDICNKYLSVPPIFYNKYLGNICGRCESAAEVEETKKLNTKKSIMERQKLFETVAPFLTFPCSYRTKGCTREIKWGEVEAHEISCPFRSIWCPLSNKEFATDDDEVCYWSGESENLIMHICETHKTYFTNNLRIILGIETASILGPLFGTDAITNEPKFLSKFLYTNLLESHAIIVIHFDKLHNYYYVKVFSEQSYYKCKSLEYQLEIFDDNKKYSITFPTASITPLANFVAKSYDEGSLEIDLNYITKLLKKPHFLSVEMRLLKNNEIVNTRNRRNSSLVPAPLTCDEHFSTNMKCSECDEYLQAPIYFCELGHNVCGECKMKEHGDTCDVCGYQFYDSYRNLTMERLTSLLNLPCKNRGVGCLFAAPVPDILEHESKCRTIGVQLRNCPFEGCQWKDFEFRTHLREMHSCLITNEMRELEARNYYILYDDHIFILEIDFVDEDGYIYKITCCETESLKYRYELQLIDGQVEQKIAGRMTFSHVCKPEYVGAEVFCGMTIPPTIFPQLFSNTTKIMFKINLFPIDEN